MGEIIHLDEVIRSSRDEARRAIIKILRIWGDHVACKNKQFGPYGTYSCASVTSRAREVASILDEIELSEMEYIAETYVGKIIKDASKYVSEIDTSVLDIECIIDEIFSRDNVELN